MRELPGTIFTTQEAREAGWTRSALRNAQHHGRIRSVTRGCYTSAPELTAVVAALAAGHRYPGAVVSHRSALLLHELPLVGAAPRSAEITVRPRSNANLADVQLYRAGLRDADVTVVGNARVTSVARTLTDVARHRPLGTAVAAIDAALHRRLVTLDEIEDSLVHCWNWPLIRRAQRAVALADGRAESPLESVSRLVFRWLRLPAPQLQQAIFDQYGRLLACVDFYWDEYGVFGEADGRMKYRGDGAAFALEKERQERLEDLTLVAVRWGWSYLTGRRYALRDRITNAFARGLARDRSGLPRLWSL